jgi:addiction module RelE/StbE family toxin
MVEIIFSDDFREEFKKIKDKITRIKIIKQIKKLESYPEAGKPLRYELKDYRSLRIAPYRLIYKIEKDKIVINCFEHRKDVYE